jgi:hypothetical protein
MRNEPASVSGIAVETEPEMVENPAQSHSPERFFHHQPCLTRPAAPGIAEKKNELMRSGKFRRLPETSMDVVKLIGELSESGF